MFSYDLANTLTSHDLVNTMILPSTGLWLEFFIWLKTICFDIVHPFEEFTHNIDQMRPIVEQKDVPLKFLVSLVLLIKIRIIEGHIVTLEGLFQQKVLVENKIN